MNSPNPANDPNPARHLAVLVVLAAFMYLCASTLRFTHDGLNLAYKFLFLLLPFFAIKPALQLRRWPKVISLVLIVPLSSLSSCGLLGFCACEIPAAVNHRQLSRELCTLQQERYSVRLAWEETAGGALGPHGVSLEQRRDILPGMYLVRPLDYFEGASEGTLSWAGKDRVLLNIPVSRHDLDQKNVRHVYSLKPWLYF
jgi:hypothetical protein